MIPDAPWITQAEKYGIPEYEELKICPICSAEAEKIFAIKGTSEIVGCDNCLESFDSWDIKIEGSSIVR